MFWRVSGLNTASPVDSILDKESFSLEELLDEDELIQECKSLNARLVTYLRQSSTVEQLVRYLVEPPPPGADPRRAFKYPFAACEIFCCEVEGIFNTLLEHEELLGQLFALLEAPRPLNCMLAGYFSRVMGSLLLRRTQDVMQYLQRHQQLLAQLVDHVDTTSVAEVLVRLVGADEQRAFLPTNYLQWLSDTDLLYRLLDKLRPGQPPEAQGNAAEILAALAQSQVSPLTKNLADPAFLELLVERALRQPGSDRPPAAETAGAAGGGAPADETAKPPVGQAAAEPAAAGPGVTAEPAEGHTALTAASEGEQGTMAAGGEGGTPPAASANGAAPSAVQGKAPAAAQQPALASKSDVIRPAAIASGMLMGAGPGGAMTHALNVCIALVEPLPPSQAEAQAAAAAAAGLGLGPPPPPAVDAAAAELHAAMHAEAVRCLARSVGHLVALLEPTEGDAALPTSYGLLRPPLGLPRLKAVELLAALLRSGDADAESAVMASGGVQRCMQLFLQYPFNNVLHRHVASLVTALDAGSPALAEFLLRDCSLLAWLVQAPREVTPPPRPGDPRGHDRPPLRAGYAGHVTQIANRLVQVANEGHTQLRAAMEGAPAWQRYVREVLEPRNAQENVFAWKCGRPAVHEPGGDAEADLFQAELDFGSGEGEGFARDVYQRYGVFGTHEEEEAEAEQQPWAVELASSTSGGGGMAGAAGGGAAPGPAPPGKLALPHAGGPQPFPVYDESSSSSSGSASSSDEEEGGSPGFRGSSEDGEAAVAPTPMEGDTAMDAGSSPPAAGGPPALPPGADDADMADDAVMLEYDTAEQLVSLSQLSLEDNVADSPGDDGEPEAGSESGGEVEPARAASPGGSSSGGGTPLAVET